MSWAGFEQKARYNLALAGLLAQLVEQRTLNP